MQSSVLSSPLPNIPPTTPSGFDSFTEISTAEKDQICVVTPARSSDGVFICSVTDCDFKTGSSKSIRLHLKSHLTDESEKGKHSNKIEITNRKQVSILGPDGNPIEPIKTEDGFCQCPLCSKAFQLRSVFNLIEVVG